MSYRGQSNWPPSWTRTRKNVVKTVRGEIGVLSYVHSIPDSSNRCYVVMEYEGESYVGTLIFNDIAFCKQVYRTLSLHLKKPIKDIGDLDLSHTL